MVFALSYAFVTVLAAVACVNAAPSMAKPAPVSIIPNAMEISAMLKAQPTNNRRLKALLADSEGKLFTGDALRQRTVFDFNQQKPAANAKGGSILLATVDNYPIVSGLGISGAVSFVEPCGLNIPHLHPRANEIFVTIDGVFDTGFVMDNGFPAEVQTKLGKYQATVFPTGSVHYQQNPTCKPAVFVAALSSEDPGRSDIGTTLFALPSGIVDATLGFPETIGGGNIDAWRAHLPPSLTAGVDSCLVRCGLKK